MGLKKYIFGSLILTIVIAGYVFSIEPGDYRIQIVDFSMVLPVAVWIVAPMLVLFIMTVLHILFYGLKNYFSLKSISKDSDFMISLLGKKLLKEESDLVFKNQHYKELSQIIKQLNISIINNDFSSPNKNIKKIVNQLIDIQAGKYISSKELKLPKNNPIMIENLKNRIATDDNFAIEAVKKNGNYCDEIIKIAFIKILETKSITTIKKLIDEINFDNDMVMALFKKDSEQQSEFAMTNDMILKLIKQVNLTTNNLITIAKNYKNSMTPEQLIKLYEDISVYNEEYTSAYLYVLSEYEMVDNIRDILSNSATHEFIAFKALVDLKDAGKNTYSLDTLCYK